MNHRLWLIFLSSVICYHTHMSAFYGERTFATICEKTKQAYLVTCKKTRAVYEKAKEHKKLVAGVAVYLAFEVVGYSQAWDTPFRRLLTPARLLEEARATIEAHQQALEQQQRDHAQSLEDQRLRAPQEQQELRKRCEELEKELRNREERRKEAVEEFNANSGLKFFTLK